MDVTMSVYFCLGIQVAQISIFLHLDSSVFKLGVCNRRIWVEKAQSTKIRPMKLKCDPLSTI